jgi:hypothetical protein
MMFCISARFLKKSGEPYPLQNIVYQINKVAETITVPAREARRK